MLTRALASYDKPETFVEALRRSMSEAHTIEALYDGWEQKIDVLRAIHRTTAGRSSVVPDMVAHLRACAVALVKKASEQHKGRSLAGNGWCGDRQRIDKSVLLLSEPRRIRCKDHLRFVASQPCLICGRAPSHAHHIRYTIYATRSLVDWGSRSAMSSPFRYAPSIMARYTRPARRPSGGRRGISIR